jgi:hypothetical protein
MNPRHSTSQRRRPRGSALLEGIVALLLLSLGIAVVGGQINSGSQLIQETEGLSRSMMLARSKLAELELGLILPEELIEGNFGKVFPGHSWRLNILPTQTPDVFFVRIDILKGLLDAPSDDETEDDYEDQEADFDDFEPQVIYTAFTYRVPPAEISLTEDFGVTEEELAQLNTGGPDGEGLLPEGFDLSQPFTPAMLADLLDDETLLKLLPVLLAMLGQSGGGQIPALANLPPELQEKLQELSGGAAPPGEDAGPGEETGQPGTEPPPAAEGDSGNEARGGRRPRGEPTTERLPTLEEFEEMMRERDRKRDEGSDER